LISNAGLEVVAPSHDATVQPGMNRPLVNPLRPELGATFDHASIQSAHPDRLASFLERAYAMHRHPVAGGWQCDAPGRTLLVTSGASGKVDYVAFKFKTDEALGSYRLRLANMGQRIGDNPSVLLDGDAFSTIDPDGNVVAFGSARVSAVSETEEEALPGRLQHCAFRTRQLVAMVTFYSDLGFVISDRVEDDDGVLRACFLRTDQEHHTLALFGAAESRLDHVSCETRDIGAIAGWADRLSKLHIPIHWGIGRHGPGNDIFLMVKDPDDNMLEVSADLEVCAAERATGTWRHEPRTLNLWGSAIMRS
jgi:hypothetical protein